MNIRAKRRHAAAGSSPSTTAGDDQTADEPETLPDESWSRRAIVAWLEAREIRHPARARKAELLKIAKRSGQR